ncbi:MAG: 2-phosphosulfolactate phosphatase, partial [Chitinophagaceae bacterium]
LYVCPSPALLHLYDVKNSIVVIIDVLRATSTVCTALYHGARQIIPVASVEECIRLGKELDAVTAGERDGIIAPGLQHGNSPFEYPSSFIQGKTLVLTTTNGTRLLDMASGAKQIITGSFPNLTPVCNYLLSQNQPVLLSCAAWKDRVNLEDMLFAGAVVNKVKEYFSIICDSALMAESLYLQAQNDLYGTMQHASHFHRLASHGLEKDIEYCLMIDIAPSLPVLKGSALIDRTLYSEV